MDVTTFLLLMTILATITGLIVQAGKKSFPNIKSRIVAPILSFIIGMIGIVVFYILKDIPFTTVNIICIPIMGLFNWLCATLGYDTVMKAINAIRENKMEK